jgi:prepilin-type N-terminal cleavage/methylation domain-containing protein
MVVMLFKLKNKSSGPARTFTRIFSKGGCFKGGFTLLEILLVVGIIAILAGIVIVAINPSKQLATVRNTQRKSDIKQVANAIIQFYIDHSYYPASTTFSTTSLMTICPTGASTSPAAGFNCAANNLLNLSELVPTYITAIPNDPGTTTTAGYSVMLVNKQPAVSAPLAELGVRVVVGNVPTWTPISGLVAHYLMNENTSDDTVTDDSNYGRHGVSNVTTDTITNVSGRINRAFDFTGSQYVSIPTDTTSFGANDKYSVSVWVNIPIDYTHTGYDTITSKRASNEDTVAEIGFEAGSGKPYFFENGGYYNADYSPPHGEWVHMVYVINSQAGTFKVYANTNIVTEQTDIVPFSGDAFQPFIFGGMINENGFGQEFHGGMDDLRYYNIELTQADVNAIYYGGVGTEME